MTVAASERLLPPIQDCARLRAMMPRVLFAAMFASISMKVGINYFHLCEAGSRLIEAGAALGTPLLVTVMILFVRRLWLGMLGAALVTIAVYACQRPYLDWIHGQ